MSCPIDTVAVEEGGGEEAVVNGDAQNVTSTIADHEMEDGWCFVFSCSFCVGFEFFSFLPGNEFCQHI